MYSQTHLKDVQLQCNKIGHLDTFTIHGNGFRAVVLKQGAQLIHFMTADNNDNNIESDEISDNWLWVSKQAQYKQGESVRGGVPICWPVFGQFDANPQTVQDSFKDCPFDLSQHGYARTQMFELNSFESTLAGDDILGDDILEEKGLNNEPYASSQLILKCQQPDGDATHPAHHLDLRVKFNFSPQGFTIALITQNNSDKTMTFSQALHTYLPTEDITATTISGFDGITYSDTLMTDTQTGGWQTRTQQGNITFSDEVDRIYHSAPNITLNTPAHTYQLQAEGSNSTVVWNPWQDKAKQISQMDANDYQHMLCIETANAHLDVVELGAGSAHTLTLRTQRDCK